MKSEIIPEEEVTVKLSLCGKCNGIVRIAIEHMMDKKSKNEFAKEVLKYNLSVKQMPLIEYRNANMDWCNCK